MSAIGTPELDAVAREVEGKMEHIRPEKKIDSVLRGPGFHMVGDGFRVQNYLAPGSALNRKTSPFLLLDSMPPTMLPPTEGHIRGVGPHPHRGFETVSLAFAGSVEHHDSFGHSGVIGPGDVQWMTAGSGILHREYHEKNFARTGGLMHFMQIWVNLPQAEKMHKPRYQALTAGQMGRVALPHGAGEVRVIAGQYGEARGPAQTFTPIQMFDIRLNAGGAAAFSLPEKENVLLMTMLGEAAVNGRETQAMDLTLFAHTGESLRVEARSDAHLVLLAGEPIDEPIAAYGPFVMNTDTEVLQAMADFRRGRFGYLEA